ncbi:NADPH-dependent assimilatory sulfite reductase hemoprotein subunit [Elioraea sp.]|uniref:NADPH-dependent assimilatory sulfite reductase hemoprotein subunit n=1 Tax=Elioraea sp. TaxID=2185103 RepID=UPI0025C5482F|nr:NADPH-dependent assimilatory sulfite reductase hemoprotein subunit [Elioraea sp.]
MPPKPRRTSVSGIEGVKAASRGLRGDIATELADATTPQVTEATYGLLKFHGTYEQHDRDTATALKQAGQEKDWQFMVRVRIPAGRLTAAQYLALDDLADRHGNGTLRITTRQTIQFHGIAKRDLRETIAAVDATLLTTFATCGDVARNVMATAAPVKDGVHAMLEESARMLSAALLPRTRAHHAIFVAGEDDGTEGEEEPLYGATYLPRKFKIGLAHPADNSIDVLANDLGLIAEVTGEAITGWIVCVGGGHGMTHNKPRTYPRLATPVGRVDHADLLAAVEAVIRLSRDFGDRSDRKRARLKYVIDDMGLDWVKDRLAERFGRRMDEPPALPTLAIPDHLGWHAQGDGRWWLGLPVPSGRIADLGQVKLRAALRPVIARFGLSPILTPQQDILLADVAEADRGAVERSLRSLGVEFAEDRSPLARWALACPALPTCGLALAEAERVREPMIGAIEAALARHGLLDERISVRITGCPNGCARPYAGDIGIVGRMPGHYALHVGGDFEGTRLSYMLHDKVKEAAVADALAPLFAAFAALRYSNEGFGDFCHRLGRDALLALPGPTKLAAD